jgi:hypothetical protein
MNIINKVALILNSCDAYSDLWEIFFDQLKLNFPIVRDMKVYINSESIDYIDEELNVINVHPPKFMPWSERLKYCLSKIEEEFTISILEDFIIESEVDCNKFYDALDLLIKEESSVVVHFVKIPGKKNNFGKGPYIQRSYDYRNLISLQASIWKTSKFLKYIQPNENPWEVEVLSSARGPIGSDTFYCVDDNETEVFDYNYGLLVMKGYWFKEELNRLEQKLSITFNHDARLIASNDDLKEKKYRLFLFYWRLRFRKYKILIFKILNQFLNHVIKLFR